MNLLFFDIECASVTRTMAKICAFGYVLCDMNFNVLQKEDILVNPKGGFHLTDGRGQRGLVLPYTYSEFKSYPPFPKVYDKIRDLLQDKNNIVCGHATLNDVKYLFLETKRFHLPPFKFDFYDSQLTYMTLIKDFTRQFGLESITEKLNVDFTPHRAADDAYATMRVAEAMCKQCNCDFLQLHKKLQVIPGKISVSGIISPKSQAQADYFVQHAKEKQERSRIRVRFYEYLSRKKRIRGGKLAGKIFNFSRMIEDDLTRSLPMLDFVYANGGTYVQKVAKSNVYVCDSNDTTERTKTAIKNETITVYSPEQLKEFVHV